MAAIRTAALLFAALLASAAFATGEIEVPLDKILATVTLEGIHSLTGDPVEGVTWTWLALASCFSVRLSLLCQCLASCGCTPAVQNRRSGRALQSSLARSLTASEVPVSNS